MTTVLTETIARLLFLPALLIATAVLVKGYAQVGDGFSAGVIAALAVLLQYLVFGYRRVERFLPGMRLALFAALLGMLLVLLVAFIPVFLGRPLLTHFPPAGTEVHHLGTLELHTAILFDLGIFFIVFGFTVSTIRFIARISHRGAP